MFQKEFPSHQIHKLPTNECSNQCIKSNQIKSTNERMNAPSMRFWTITSPALSTTVTDTGLGFFKSDTAAILALAMESAMARLKVRLTRRAMLLYVGIGLDWIGYEICNHYILNVQKRNTHTRTNVPFFFTYSTICLRKLTSLHIFFQ